MNPIKYISIFSIASSALVATGALAQPPIQPTDDRCFTKMGAAYEAYRNNGVRGNANSLIPHIYSDYLNNTGSGVFCYDVRTDPNKVPDATVVATYFNGGVPGDTFLEVSNAGTVKTTAEQIVASDGAWAEYVQDENCCGPKKAFYYCSLYLGKMLNITGCSDEPQYEYVPVGENGAVTTLGTIFRTDVTDEGKGGIFCGCVLNAGGGPDAATKTVAESLGLDQATIRQIIEENSVAQSGAERVVGMLVALACAMAMLA